MGTGYTRQSSATIIDAATITATMFNAEFNLLESAFNAATGHTHDGTVGEGPQINLTNGVTSVLPIANGGTNAITAAAAATNLGLGTGDTPTFTGVNISNVDTTVTRASAGVIAVEGVNVLMTSNIGSTVQAYDAELAAIAGLTSAADRLPYFTGSGTAALATFSTFARTILDDADAATVLTTIGAQPLDSELTALASTTSAADKVPYFTGAGTATTATLTSFARTLLDDADAATMRTTLGVTESGTAQPLDTELTAIAALVSAADRLPYFTGSGTASLATFTAAGRALVDDADASAQRTTLGLAIGTNVQAYDAELAAIAGLVSAADSAPYFTGSGTASLMTVTSAARSILDDTTVGAIRTTLGVGTADAVQVGTIELSNATDTTLGRAAAGVMQVEGNVVPSPASQASGDMLYRGASSWDRLAKGTAAQELRMNAGATAPEWVSSGICRAWVRFNGTGTPAIAGSFNVTSITDNGTGNYTINFTNALSSANYAVVGTAKQTDSSAVERLYHVQPYTYLTTSVSIRVAEPTSGANTDPNALDAALINVIIFG